MNRLSLAHFLVGLILLIAGLHLSAFLLHLYWLYFWFDLVVHFLGGFWIGLLVLWLFFFSPWSGVGLKNRSRERDFLLLALGAALAVAIIWEVFELVIGAVTVNDRYVLDTVYDILFGTLGGALAAVVGYRRYIQIKLNQ